MPSSNGGRVVRVLLADDTEDMRALLRLTLQKDGRFDVVAEAADGARAVELAEATKPDVMVLDLAMPVMDGLQALPLIRKVVPECRIVVLSGFNASQMAEEALTLGADAYLEKGAAFHRLVDMLLEGLPDRAPTSAQRTEALHQGVVAQPQQPAAASAPSERDALARRALEAVTGSAHLTESFENLGHVLAEVVRFDRASFWVTVDGDNRFACVAVTDPDAKRLPIGATMSVHGRARRVLEGRPAMEPDTATDQADTTNAALAAAGIRSYVTLPLVIAGEVKAIINVSSTRPNAFSHEDVPVLERLTRETASTLHLLYLLDREREEGSRLREAHEMRDDMVGMVAHDLRSPMTVIGGYAQHMKDSWTTLPEEQKLQFLETISRNVEDVAQLVEDMTEVASLESGQLTCDMEEFDLGETVREAVAELAVANLGRTCKMSLPEDLPKAIGDSRRQRQVLANLVCNALKFSPPTKPVEVTVVLDGSQALVSVRDHGCGIEFDHLDKIFQKFYRVKNDARARVPGTGLGLYICKLLVEAQGGQIWAESTPGHGSTFSYTVRVVEAHAVARDEPAA